MSKISVSPLCRSLSNSARVDNLHLPQHLEVVSKMAYRRNPSISMAAHVKQRQHPKIGNKETVRTPEEAGVEEAGTGATT